MAGETEAESSMQMTVPSTGGVGRTARVLTVGAPIVAVLPTGPEPIGAASTCRFAVGGAEVNLAVGLARLGVAVEFIGRVGDDPLGAMVLDRLRGAGIGCEGVVVDVDRATDLYLREWLPDGLRRPLYYRTGTAGAALCPDDVDRWIGTGPDGFAAIDAVHLTGITPALGASATAAVRAVIDAARAAGAPIGLDPNHRPRLWSAEDARPVLVEMARAATLLLLSNEDAEVLFGPGLGVDAVIDAAHALGPALVVFKSGADGAVISDGRGSVEVPALSVPDAVDPVGAGDAFDAGFIAGWLRGDDLETSGRLGAQAAAAVIRRPGEHEI